MSEAEKVERASDRSSRDRQGNLFERLRGLLGLGAFGLLGRRRRRSARAYPPSPRRSHCATRVTVVVDACARFATSRYGSPSSSSRATCHRCAIASSSEIVQRSRRNRSVSSRFFSDATVANSSSCSPVGQCRGSFSIAVIMLAC